MASDTYISKKEWSKNIHFTFVQEKGNDDEEEGERKVY